MALRITDAQLAVLAAAGCGVQEVPLALILELRDEDGEPVPDERFEARLPDGSVRRGTTDGQGAVCLEAVPPGTCEVTFPLASTRLDGAAGPRHRCEAGSTAQFEKVGAARA
jgi:hypothetical protein